MDESIFRKEALDYRAASRTQGELLMVMPGWTRWTYRLLLALFASAAVFLIFGSVPQYSEGPAVIRAGDSQRFSVIVLLPGRHRPELAKGQNLRLALTGYSYVFHDLTIERVDDEVIAPQDVRRKLGREGPDAIAMTGPVVVVHATLPATSFETGGHTYRYHDGMQGMARARLRSERPLTTLVPGFRSVMERHW